MGNLGVGSGGSFRAPRFSAVRFFLGGLVFPGDLFFAVSCPPPRHGYWRVCSCFLVSPICSRCVCGVLIPLGSGVLLLLLQLVWAPHMETISSTI